MVSITLTSTIYLGCILVEGKLFNKGNEAFGCALSFEGMIDAGSSTRRNKRSLRLILRPIIKILMSATFQSMQILL